MGVEEDLIAMGFAPMRVRAATSTCDTLEAALQWLIDQPEAEEAGTGASSAETELLGMGFELDRAQAAVRACGDDLEAALQWLVEDGELEAERPTKMPRVAADAPAPAARRDPPPAPPPPVPPPPAPPPPAPPPPVPPPAAPVAEHRSLAASSSSSSVPSALPSTPLKRLMTEYRSLVELEKLGGSRKLHGFEASPLDPSDMFTWELRLFDFDEEQEIAADMFAREIDHVALRVHFPIDYPNAPPFVHMLRPRLKESTGYVLPGGGICMELLTPSEWSPATSISALVMSVRAMLLVGKARLKSIAPHVREADYRADEARRDFAHILKIHSKHGWTSHPVFKNA